MWSGGMIRNAPFEFDADDLTLRLDRTIPGCLEAIQPLVDEIMEAITGQGCAEGGEVQIEVALLEALSNAVRHGCGEDSDRLVEVCVACEQDRGVLIVVRDPGAGFDPEEIPSPVQGERLLASGGRGVFLINQLMDEVTYRRGGTEIWMRKRPKT